MASSNSVIVHLRTYRPRPYWRIVLRGEVFPGTITGTVEIDNGGDNDPDGSFSLQGFAPVGDVLYWDLYIPAVGTDKIDAYYFNLNGFQVTGRDILSGAVTGTLQGTDFSISYGNGDSFSGQMKGGIIDHHGTGTRRYQF